MRFSEKLLHMFRERPVRLGLVLSLCVVVIAAGYLLTARTHPSLEAYAQRIIKNCAQVEGGALRCYDREVPKIMSDGVSLVDAFEVIRLIQQEEPSYQFCHIAGHGISEYEYAKDPSKWREIIKECPIGICSNGCLHGALQAHFSSESLNHAQINDILPDLSSVCEQRPGWSPTNQQQSSCYHEIGHAALYVAGANPQEAYRICEQAAVKADGRNFLQTCTEGVFMQVFQPLSVDDFTLVYPLIPHKEELAACESEQDLVKKARCWRTVWIPSYKNFCNQFSGEARNGCFREAWLVDPKTIASPEGMLAYCAYSTDPKEQAACFNKMIYSLMASVDFNQEKVTAMCLRFDGALQGSCFAHMASRMIETDKKLIQKALDVCTYATTRGVGGACYTELFYYAGFLYKKDTHERVQLCDGLPEDVRTACKAQ